MAAEAIAPDSAADRVRNRSTLDRLALRAQNVTYVPAPSQSVHFSRTLRDWYYRPGLLSAVKQTPFVLCDSRR